VPRVITPELEQEVMLKLRTDPIYFIERCLFIVDQDGKNIPFKLNAVQRDFILNRSKNDIVLKSRKQGMSSIILALSRSNIWSTTRLHAP